MGVTAVLLPRPVAHNPIFPHRIPSRQVTSEEGGELAQTHHAAWIETSAKNNKNVGTYLSTFVPPQ